MRGNPTVGRRRFVQAGLAFGAPLVLPPHVLGGRGLVGPNDQVRLAFIGCGRQTILKNIPLFLRTPGVRVAAMCDVDSWRLEQAVAMARKQYATGRAKGELGQVETTVDYQQVLAREDIDAVCLGTPDHWHLPMAIEAMRAGKDVALEKPIVRSIASGRKLVEVAEQTGRVFRVDTEFRSGIDAHRAAMLVRNGLLGAVKRVEVGVPVVDKACPFPIATTPPPELDYQRWLGPAAPAPYSVERVHHRRSLERSGWFSLSEYSDGVVTNWGSHLNDGALWALGKERTLPINVRGSGVWLPAESFYDVLAEFDVTFEYADGVEHRYSTGQPEFKIIGEEGWVSAGFRSFEASKESLKSIDLQQLPVQLPFMSEKQDFINAVRERGTTAIPADIGHNTNTLCLMAKIAVREGGTLEWDAAAERFVGDDRANRWLDRPVTPPKADERASR